MSSLKIKFIIASIMVFANSAILFAGEKPKLNTYKEALISEMPNYLELLSYKIEAEENVGNKVEPIWVSRFKATAKCHENLINFDQRYDKILLPPGFNKVTNFFPNTNRNEVNIYKIKNHKNSVVEMYGKTVAKIFKGKIKVEFDYDFDKKSKYRKNHSKYYWHDEFGIQQSSLDKNHYPYLLLGSDRAKEYERKVAEYDKEIQKKLAAFRTEIAGDSEEKLVAEKGNRLYQDAIDALNRGDTPLALKIMRSMEAIHQQLKTEYMLQIVSRPNTPSGVWRYPRNNKSSRNYYIIVEAVTPEGNRMALPITSEEDGKTSTAQMWGIRVPDRVFIQISRDKKDNGIIDKNRFGIKRQGYLTPEYLYPTTGGMITKW